MKQKLKALLSVLFRIDVFNRIIVFVSMALFIVFPSYLLYFIPNYSDEIGTVLPCLLLLGVVIGTGLFTLYRPNKLSWFYFLETGFVLGFYADRFLHVTSVDVSNISTAGIFYSEVTYCSIGIIINLLYFFSALRKKRRGKNDFNEATNADTFYDFLNGKPTNAYIEASVEKISKQGGHDGMAFVKRVKFSRIVRIISLFAFLIMACYYLIFTAQRFTLTLTEIYYPCLLGILLLPTLLVGSVLFPREFKYVYFYNGILFSFGILFSCAPVGANPLGAILSLIVLFLSLLIGLITEGRTWTGAKPD
jgi:hypothetical protein